MWSDIAALTFAAVAINHLGLIDAIKKVIRCKQLPVIDCPKCLSFWSTLVYQVAEGCFGMDSVAISLACAWLAVWLELGMGFSDLLFEKAYERIYTETTAANQTHTGTADTDGSEN